MEGKATRKICSAREAVFHTITNYVISHDIHTIYVDTVDNKTWVYYTRVLTFQRATTPFTNSIRPYQIRRNRNNCIYRNPKSSSHLFFSATLGSRIYLVEKCSTPSTEWQKTPFWKISSATIFEKIYIYICVCVYIYIRTKKWFHATLAAIYI